MIIEGLDGLPPLDPSDIAVSSFDYVSTPVPMDVVDEELLYVQIEDDEEVYAVSESHRTVVEAI